MDNITYNCVIYIIIVRDMSHRYSGDEMPAAMDKLAVEAVLIRKFRLS